MSESVRKKSKSAPTFKLKIFKNLENIGQSAADKRSEIQRKSVSAKTTQFSKNANETKEIAAAGPGYDLTGPLFGPLFFKIGISIYGVSIVMWPRTHFPDQSWRKCDFLENRSWKAKFPNFFKVESWPRKQAKMSFSARGNVSQRLFGKKRCEKTCFRKFGVKICWNPQSVPK